MRIESGVAKFSPIHIILESPEEALFFKTLGNIAKRIAEVAGREGGSDRLLTDEEIKKFAKLLGQFWYGRFAEVPFYWGPGK